MCSGVGGCGEVCSGVQECGEVCSGVHGCLMVTVVKQLRCVVALYKLECGESKVRIMKMINF